MSFTNSFGGSPINPAFVAYAAVSLQTSTQFYWPMFSAGQANVVARFMNVQSASSGLNLKMPDATLVSLGYDSIIFNGGSLPFNVVSSTGAAIATIQPGTAWYIQVTDNASPTGAWLVTQFGAGTSSAQASQLAGQGLAAMAGVLNLNLNAVYTSNDLAISTASLSQLYVWQGGAGTFTLPSAASAGDGFFFMAANAGSGNLTIATQGADEIDGASTSVFSQLQSAFIVCTGTGWNTVGKGTQTNFAFTLLNLNVAGSSNVTLNSTQAQNVIQVYTGALTGNIQVIVPNTVQFYIVNNQTSGAFTLTLITAAGTGIQIPQGQTSMAYCDGTNVVSAFSFVPSGSTFAGGSAASPGINWQGNTNTGFYQPTTNQVGISTNGLPAQTWSAQASAVNYFQTTASATTNPIVLQATGTDGNISMEYLAKGTGQHLFLNSGANYMGIAPATASNGPTLGSLGSDTNVDINFLSKGTGIYNFGNTTCIQLPDGTTGQRPTGAASQIRYNTSNGAFEGFTSAWTNILTGIDNLASLSNASTARANLGLTIGAGLQSSGSSVIWDLTTEQSIASAATCDLGTKTSNIITISGTTGITSFGNSANVNNPLYFVRMQGAVLLTNSGTLILPGSANYTTAAGDILMCKFEGSSTWRVTVFPASGGSPVSSGVSSFSGDGNFITNVSSTGAVTATIKTAAGGTVWGNNTGSTAAPAYTAAPVLGINTNTAGTLGLANSGASGATITVKNLGCTSAYNFNLPTTAGSANNVLASQGGVSTSMTWLSASGLLDIVGSTRGSVLYRGSGGWAILTPGTSGNVLTSNGAGADPAYAAVTTGIGKVSVQTFTGSGTYTPTAGTKYAIVEAVGGGGGSAGVASNVPIGGASGGSYARVLLTSAQIGASQTITIGAAGTAGTTAPTNGGTGGVTSVGSLFSCPGGIGSTGGGSTANNGAAAPAACTITTGTSIVNIAGQAGQPAWAASAGNGAGAGGNSSLGFGGPGSNTNVTNPAAATSGTGYGAGAGGAAANGGSAAGAAGTAGIVIITEYQ